MTTEEDIQRAKDKFLPESIRDHFIQANKSADKNIKIFENLKAPDGSTIDQVAIIMMLNKLGASAWHAIKAISSEMEIGYLATAIARTEIKHIKETMNQQGMDIDRFSKYDGLLNHIDGYLKRVPREADDKDD